MKIDSNIISDEIGIELHDNGDGHLGENDILIKRTNNSMERHIVTNEDMQSTASIESLLREFSQSNVSIDLVANGSNDVYIGAASTNQDNYLRLYKVETHQDQSLIQSGSSIPFPTPRSITSRTLSPIPTISRYGSSSSLGTLSSGQAFDLVTSDCDDLPIDSQHDCHAAEIQAEQRAKRLAELQTELASKKEQIRDAIIEGNLQPELIAEVQEIQSQIQIVE